MRADVPCVNEVHGKKGSISFTKKPGSLAVFYNEKGEWEFPEVSAPYPVTAACLFAECFRALEEGRPVPVDGMEGRKNLEVVVAAYRSARVEI